MNNLSSNLNELDRTIHEPARLLIMTALSVAKSADFLFLQNLTGLTAGNLSGHLSRLEEAGFVNIIKEIVGKRPRTTVSLTPAGRQAIESHWRQLETLKKKAGEIGESQP